MSEFGLALQRASTRALHWLETCGAFLHVRLKLGAQPDDEE